MKKRGLGTLKPSEIDSSMSQGVVWCRTRRRGTVGSEGNMHLTIVNPFATKTRTSTLVLRMAV